MKPCAFRWQSAVCACMCTWHVACACGMSRCSFGVMLDWRRGTWGKKNAGKAKQLGCPDESQPRMKPTRRVKSLVHDERGFSEGYATLAQLPGT